ncbi:MAG: SBBP repeat-containing protein, partial [Thermoplasmatales archaeon]
MNKELFIRGLVFVVIVIFIGAIFSPSICSIKLQSNLSVIDYSKSNVKENGIILNNAQTWLWAKGIGGTGDDYGVGVEIDTNGNIYMTGWFNGTALFGDTTLISQGDWDVYVAKLDSDGIWQWAVRAGGTNYDGGYDIAVDNSGNVYIIGSYNGTAKFGNTSLTSQGHWDVFIAKLDVNGVWQWAESAGGPSYNNGVGIALDTGGNIYITGSFRYPATFGGNPLTNRGYDDIFIAKLDANGVWQWAESAGSTRGDYGYDVVLDTNDNVIITGNFYGPAIFGNTSLVSKGELDVFVAKLDNNGVWLWAKSAGGRNYDYAYDVALDNTGNIYITGNYRDTAWFLIDTLVSQGSADVFVAKIDTNGSWQWAKSGGGTGFDNGYGIAMDIDGNIYITGYFKYTAMFGSTNLNSQGDADVLISKLNTDGDWLWANSAGGTRNEYGYDIAVDNSKNICITGYFNDTVTFGNIPLTSQGSNDIFIASLSDVNQPPTAPKIEGPSSGEPGIEYEYTLNSTDPEELPIMYFIDWGDNTSEWTEYCSSGVEITLKHIWENQGTYLIKAKTKDLFDAESEWSEFEV